MEFIIYSTSERMEEHSDWKTLEKEFTIKKKQLPFVSQYGYKEAYFIEIKSIEELVKLCQYESIIIHNKGYKNSRFDDIKDAFSIEIYDDYRE